MARHLWLGRAFCVLALLGLTGQARADHFLTHPAPQAAPEAAPQTAETPFENAAPKGDANVYITPRNIPKNDRYLKAYNANQAAKGTGGGVAAPGLLGIASQAYRAQNRPAPDGPDKDKKAYSLADAMRDAMWRKKTAQNLKTLTSERPPVLCTGTLSPIDSSKPAASAKPGNC